MTPHSGTHGDSCHAVRARKEFLLIKSGKADSGQSRTNLGRKNRKHKSQYGSQRSTQRQTRHPEHTSIHRKSWQSRPSSCKTSRRSLQKVSLPSVRNVEARDTSKRSALVKKNGFGKWKKAAEVDPVTSCNMTSTVPRKKQTTDSA